MLVQYWYILVNLDCASSITFLNFIELPFYVRRIVSKVVVTQVVERVDRHLALEEIQRAILHAVEILRVGQIIFIGAIDLVLLPTLLHRAINDILLSVQQLARDERPRQQLALPVERGEEAVLLPPNQVLALVAHADALDLVDVGERDDHELVVAAQVGEPVAEFALAE